MNLCIEYWFVPLPRLLVTTRIFETFLLGDPFNPSFATNTGKGDNPMNKYAFLFYTEVRIPMLGHNNLNESLLNPYVYVGIVSHL